MAYTTINKSTAHFNTKLYTGNGSQDPGQSITGVGFQPDMAWIKGRSSTDWHDITDAVRGATKSLFTNTNNAEATSTTALKSFLSDGYNLGSNSQVNGNGTTYVGWNWKANGSSTVTNNDGATTSYISHNSTAQFSIIKYTGTGSNTNIGHGLNGTPDCFITKARTASDWHLWNNSFTANQRIKINSTGGVSTNTSIFPSLPDATRIYFGTGGDVNQSGIEYICYAWKNVTGYSKSGSYKGNNNANGVFIYTGFKPAFVIIKRSSAGENWSLYDNKRLGYNPQSLMLRPNTSDVEGSYATSDSIDFVSNAFKIRTSGTALNDGTYIYMAFAEAPLVGTNNVPCTAR